MDKKRIVVIDDLWVTLCAIEHNIARDNREIFLFQEIEEAENTIDKLAKVDFLIADLKVGYDSSENAIKRIRNKYPNIKIAVITGGRNVSGDDIKRIGADRFFLKPIDYQILDLFLTSSDSFG